MYQKKEQSAKESAMRHRLSMKTIYKWRKK